MTSRNFAYDILNVCLVAVLCLGVIATASADRSEKLPDNYPSHAEFDQCNVKALQTELQAYNDTRLEVAKVMRHLADDQPMKAETRTQLIGYAENLDSMRTNMPAPDPDSDEFRNFDFKLGLTFTAIAIFLNTNDPQLAERFSADQDDPQSMLSRYLVRLNHTRDVYMKHVDQRNTAECG